MTWRPSFLGLVACAAATALAGSIVACAPAEEPRGAAAEPTAAPAVGGLQWAVPGRWTRRPPSGLRAAEYEVPDGAGGAPAVCSVFYFGHGRVGTMEANLERWRGQFQRLDHADRAARDVGGLELIVVEMEGRYAASAAAPDAIDDALLLGAAIDGPEGPVFVKCVGRRPVLDGGRSEFVAFLASFSAN